MPKSWGAAWAGSLLLAVGCVAAPTAKGGDCTEAQVCGGLCCSSDETCRSGACVAKVNDLGRPCSTDAACSARVCLYQQTAPAVGYCSFECSSSASCVGPSQQAWCISAGHSTSYCELGCKTSSDCASLGADYSCNAAQDVDGTLGPRCGVFQNLAGAAPCMDSSQCASGTCDAWCISFCKNQADCGDHARCIEVKEPPEPAPLCFPICSSNADCVVYGPKFACHTRATVDGSSGLICEPAAL